MTKNNEDHQSDRLSPGCVEFVASLRAEFAQFGKFSVAFSFSLTNGLPSASDGGDNLYYFRESRPPLATAVAEAIRDPRGERQLLYVIR